MNLKQEKIFFTPKAVLNFYIVYKIKLWPLNLYAWFTLLNTLFGAVKLSKNAYSDKYYYSGYGTGFDTCGTFSLTDNSEFGKNVIIFKVGNSSSVYADNRKKDIYIKSIKKNYKKKLVKFTL